MERRSRNTLIIIVIITVQLSTIQYSTMQYSTVQYNAMQDFAVQYNVYMLKGHNSDPSECLWVSMFNAVDHNAMCESVCSATP